MEQNTPTLPSLAFPCLAIAPSLSRPGLLESPLPRVT